MNTYTTRAKRRNTRIPSKPIHHEPELTKGGKVVKHRRPHWSASLCNTVASLAGIGHEVRHVG